MKDLEKINNPFGDDKVIDACSIFGMMDTSGRRFSGKDIIKAIANMHVRGNGLGGGLAVYGIYPDYAELYAFHIMFLSQKAKQDTETFLKEKFYLVKAEDVPTRPANGIVNPPVVWRYF